MSTGILKMRSVGNQWPKRNIAHRYALALYNATMKLTSHEREKIFDDVEYSRAFFARMSTMIFAKACFIKRFAFLMLSELNNELKSHKIFYNLLSTIVENGRFDIIKEIFDDFTSMRNYKDHTENVVITSNYILPSENKTRIENSIRAEIGEDVNIEFVYEKANDSSYGFTIQYNGKILDYSSKTQIHRLLNDLQVWQ